MGRQFGDRGVAIALLLWLVALPGPAAALTLNFAQPGGLSLGEAQRLWHAGIGIGAGARLATAARQALPATEEPEPVPLPVPEAAAWALILPDPRLACLAPGCIGAAPEPGALAATLLPLPPVPERPRADGAPPCAPARHRGPERCGWWPPVAAGWWSWTDPTRPPSRIPVEDGGAVLAQAPLPGAGLALFAALAALAPLRSRRPRRLAPAA